ncbi:MAG: 16S rRNA (uracil(1498)-N(3))-methyltransferase [Spirochaetaceae bacterium]|nr:16S rRNA (uracil(1498)-N(3))-methyltransferase [Spirochaetaceae bacterium]
MRQFLCGSFPDDSGKLIVKDRNYRYLVKVLRFSEGDKFDARLPDGQLVQFCVEKVMPSSAVLRLSGSAPSQVAAEFARTDGVTGAKTPGAKTAQGVQAAEVQSLAERTPEIWLFQFLPKPQKMDLIVRQAAECGVKRIIPIAGEYSVKNDAAGRIERWERIIREARQQSGSGVDTEITDVVAVGAAAEMWKEFSADAEKCAQTGGTLGASCENPPASCAASATASCAFLLDENPSVGKSSLTRIDGRSVSAAALAVGCEGGISDNERKVLAEAGFEPLHFTTNVLRAETAAIYGIAVIQQFLSAD